MLPIHTILYPTDFSEYSRQAFPLACVLGRDCGARIVALHVVPPPLGQDKVLIRQKPDEYYDGARKSLHNIKAPDDNVRVEHRLADGHAAAEILKAAAELQAGLIIIGTHGRSGLGRLVIGSVAEEVLRGAACPVLAVKKSPLGIKTILFPTDLSKLSEAAFSVALALARDYDARVIALYVAPPEQTESSSRLADDLKNSLAFLRDADTTCKRSQVKCDIEVRIKRDSPAEEILRVGQDTSCDLIVMGTHSRTGLARVVMGSVAEETLRRASCPVLLVKSPVIRFEASPKPQP